MMMNLGPLALITGKRTDRRMDRCYLLLAVLLAKQMFRFAVLFHRSPFFLREGDK